MNKIIAIPSLVLAAALVAGGGYVAHGDTHVTTVKTRTVVHIEKVKSAPVIEWKTKTVIKTVKVTVTAPAVAPAPVTPSDPGYLNPVTLADALDGSLADTDGYTYQCVPDGTDQFTCTSSGGFEGTTEPFTGTATVSANGATYTFEITSPQEGL
jgi:hypothetical protein